MNAVAMAVNEKGRGGKKMTVSAELVVDAKAELGEGPSWDAGKQKLYWVDIMGQKVHSLDPGTGKMTSFDTGLFVGAAVPREKGGLILATHKGFYTLDVETGKISFIHDPEPDLSGNRFNDGKCDPAGRFWAGTMSFNEQDPTGSLYRLDADLSVHQMLDQITISNGLAWTSDHKTMYYIDSPTKQVVAFDYDLDTGEIHNKRTVITIPDGEGVPDGMAIDSEDKLWVAQFGGSKVSRWDPETGERLLTVSLPATNVTSCVFGGQNLDELYITTARKGLSKEQLEQQPQAGGVFRYKTDVKGTPTYLFKG